MATVGWGDHDGGEGYELDELVRIADDHLQFGAGNAAGGSGRKIGRDVTVNRYCPTHAKT